MKPVGVFVSDHYLDVSKQEAVLTLSLKVRVPIDRFRKMRDQNRSLLGLQLQVGELEEQ